MPAYIGLNLSPEEVASIKQLEKESYESGNMRQYKRCRAILTLGTTNIHKNEIAASLGVGRHSINLWIKSYLKKGVNGLRLGKCGGSKSRLSEEQLQKLSQIIEDGPQKYGFDTAIWTSPLVREVVIKEFNEKYDVSHIRRILERLGFSVQYPRFHLAKADYERQRSWIKNDYADIKKKPKKKMGW